MTRAESHRRICDQLSNTYIKKNSDYGNSFRVTREKYPNAILVRLCDKLSRLEQLMSPGYEPKVVDEAIEDSLCDLANYAIMELVEREMDAQKAVDEA